MVYNWRDDARLGGRELIGASMDAHKRVRGTLTFVLLAALAATIFLGCAAGSGGSSQGSEKQQASGTAHSSGQKTGGSDASGRTSGGNLGHPTLGSADAPVVLTEYGDYQ
jgi:uncharacterized membrane protein